MNNDKFLRELVPPNGLWVLSTIVKQPEKSYLKNKFFDDLDDLLEEAREEQTAQNDVYIALANYKDNSTRSASNAETIKAFYIDLDVDADSIKCYSSKKEALTALINFVNETKLPKPTIVDSGGGIHAYWTFTQAVSIVEWKPVADNLKALCKEKGFMIDRSVTADAARVTRLVGFQNFKRGGVLATVKAYQEPIEFSKLAALINPAEQSLDWLSSAKQQWMVGSQLENTHKEFGDRVSYFKKIAIKSLKESGGCPQLKQCMTDPAGVPEPLWRAGLSIAWACEDREKAIHKFSQGHPEYNAKSTDEKARQTRGPYKCETFDDINPGICPNCPNWSKIVSPIQLGTELKESATNEVGDYKPKTDLMAPAQFTIPKYPEPFFRPESGGVALAVETGDGVTEPWLLTDIDIWPEKLIRDEHTQDLLIWMRTYHPKQGLNDFVIPNCTSQSNELAKKLEQKGLIFSPKAMKPIQEYIYHSVRSLNNRETALTAPNKFGWDPNFSTFTIGDRKYDKLGKYSFAPPSTYTASLIPFFKPKGDIKEWQKALAQFCVSDPDYYPLLSVVLSSLASILMPFTGKNGVVLSVYGESGHGKTTAQKFGLSIFGNPTNLLLTTKDTYKSWVERMGTSGNLPVGFEEMTLCTSDMLRKITYDVTEGRSGNQANQYGGGEKISGRTWSLMATMSANDSLKDKLIGGSGGRVPEANVARVLELQTRRVSGIDKDKGDWIERTAHENYGVAGEILIPYILTNTTEIAKNVNRYITETAQFKEASRERFQIAGYGALLAAADILNATGLASIEIEPYRKFLQEIIVSASDMLNTVVEEKSAIFSEFLRHNMRHCMVVDKSTTGEVVVIDPERVQHPVKIRFEKHINKMYIPVSEMRAFCSDQGFYYKDLVLELLAKGMIKNKNAVNKRLLAGLFTGTTPTPLRCFEIDLSECDE